MPRIVYLTPSSPLPPDRGGRSRAFHLWRALSRLGDTTCIVVGDRSNFASRQCLRSWGGCFLPRRRYDVASFVKANGASPNPTLPGLWEAFPPRDFPPSVWAALDSPKALTRHNLNARRITRLRSRIAALDPHLVVLCDVTMASLAEDLASEKYRLVVAPHNVDSQLYAMMAAQTDDFAYGQWSALVAQACSGAEAGYSAADQIWVCSGDDATRFAERLATDRIRLVPNVVEVEGAAGREALTRNIVYIGQLGYHPNELAALELVKISRILSERGVDHKMQLVGTPTARLTEAARQASAVEVLGYVADVAPYLRGAALVATPLTIGGGTRIKLLEAMAANRPILTTSIGIEGIEAVSGVHAVIEDDLARFPDHITDLLDQRERALELGTRARALAVAGYSLEAMIERLRSHFEDLQIPSDAGTRPVYPITLRESAARFNRSTGLLELSFTLETPAPHRSLDCSIELDGARLPNGAVRIFRPVDYRIQFEGEVVLRPNMDPARVRFVVRRGTESLISITPDPVETVSDGLLSIEPTQDATGREIRLWLEGGTAEFSLDGVAHRLDAKPGVVGMNHSGERGPDSIVVSPAPPGQLKSLGFARWTSPATPCSIRLQSMKGSHEGAIAWLIGNGPSVRLDDLAVLSGALSFGFNRLHLAYPDTPFRPTFTLCSDRQMIEDFGQEIVDQSAGTVFLADLKPPPLVGNYIWLRQLATFPPVFSLDPLRAVNPGGSSLFVAMQIAFFMGIRRFYFYGADSRFDFATIHDADDTFRSATGEGNHFIPNYRSGRPWCPPSYQNISAAFICARRVIESNGGWIRNATRGGLLDIFERQDFDAAVSESRSAVAASLIRVA